MIMTKRMSTIKDANTSVMGELSGLVDTLLRISPMYDSELQKFVVKFQVEHAAAKAEFQCEISSRDTEESSTRDFSEATTPDMRHLHLALKRMIDLGAAVAQQVLRKSLKAARGLSPSPCSSFSSEPVGYTMSERSPSLNSNDDHFTAALPGLRASSVEDILATDESWIECGANLMHAAVEIMSLALVVHPELRSQLQLHLVNECKIVNYLVEAMQISKEHEVNYFAMGFKTDHVKLVANITFDNSDVGRVISGRSELMNELLNGTRIDDDNPGMVEWAEFAIRNLCCSTEEARDSLRKMRPVGVHPETEEFLGRGKKVSKFDATGKLTLEESDTT